MAVLSLDTLEWLMLLFIKWVSAPVDGEKLGIASLNGLNFDRCKSLIFPYRQTRLQIL
ncbi:MAG TPA: hypothetical protein V6C78_05545 [Crinalium sp.]